MKTNVALYLTLDKGDVVAEGDPRAAFLLTRGKRDISVAELRQIGGQELVDKVRALAAASPDDEDVENHDGEFNIAQPRRRGRGGRQTSPADAGAESKPKQPAAEPEPETPPQEPPAEPEDLSDKNLAELRAIAMEREVAFDEDDDEDVLRLRLADDTQAMAD